MDVDCNLFFVCPTNCGSEIFNEIRYEVFFQTSSGIIFIFLGAILWEVMKSRTDSVTADFKEFTCVPPSDVGIRFT